MSGGRGERAARAALVVAGAAGAAVGAQQLLAHVPAGSWWPVVRWAAGAVLVHDLLLAPLAVGLGVLLLRRRDGGDAPRAGRWRGVLLLAASLGAVAAALVLAVPGRNPSVVPHGWVPGALTAAAVVLAVAAAARLLPLRRGRPRGRRG